ncbi:MAG: hypothetical protein AAGA54_19620 [Myxococcota bacterium]
MGALLGITSIGCQIEDQARTDVERMLPVLCEAEETCRCASQTEGDACEERQATWSARIDYGRAKGLVYDAACLQTIEASIVERSCRSADTSDEHLCTEFCGVFHGSVQMGEACESFDEVTSNCAQGLTCLDGTCAGPCTVLGGLAEGATCRTENGEEFDDCASGLSCAWETGQCIKLPEIGDRCADGRCGDGAFCNWSTETCTARRGEGESCQEAECAVGLRCDWERDECRAPAGVGEPCWEVGCADGLSCDQNDQCAPKADIGESCERVECVDGSWCDWDIGRCAPFPDGEGQPCARGECAGRLWCDQSAGLDGECRERVPDGAACSGHRQCDSGFCPAGFCAVLPLEGESCTDVNACANGLVCDGSVCIPALNRGSAVCSFAGW